MFPTHTIPFPPSSLQEELAHIMEDAKIMPSVLQVEVSGCGNGLQRLDCLYPRGDYWRSYIYIYVHIMRVRPTQSCPTRPHSISGQVQQLLQNVDTVKTRIFPSQQASCIYWHIGGFGRTPLGVEQSMHVLRSSSRVCGCAHNTEFYVQTILYAICLVLVNSLTEVAAVFCTRHRYTRISTTQSCSPGAKRKGSMSPPTHRWATSTENSRRVWRTP